MGDKMIYICAKCKFLFERRNEPSKCPSCENLSVLEANDEERQIYKHLLDDTTAATTHPDTSEDKT